MTGAAPPVPWPLVAAFAAGLVGPTLTVAVLAPELAPAAAGGATLGVIGPAFGGVRRSALGAILAFAVLALGSAGLGLDPRIGALVLAAAAGAEAGLRGGRTLTVALFAAVLLVFTGASASTGWHVAGLAFAGAVAAGALVPAAFGLAGKFAPPAAGRVAGVEHGLFLAAGLMVSLALVGTLAAPHAVWIAQLFVLRGLAPPELRIPMTLRFAGGVLAGAAIAVAVELAGLVTTPAPRLALASAALIAGLRYAAGPPALTAGAFTLVVLMTTGPTPAEAVFRAEAALFAAAIAIGLAIALQAVFSRARAAR